MEDKKSPIKDWLIVIAFFGVSIAVIGVLMAWDDGLFDGTRIDTVLSMLVPSAFIGFSVMIFVVMWACILNKKMNGCWLIFFATTAIAYMYFSTKPNTSEYQPILFIGAVLITVTAVIRTIVYFIRLK